MKPFNILFLLSLITLLGSAPIAATEPTDNAYEEHIRQQPDTTPAQNTHTAQYIAATRENDTFVLGMMRSTYDRLTTEFQTQEQLQYRNNQTNNQ
jgi:hypothetical protein